MSDNIKGQSRREAFESKCNTLKMEYDQSWKSHHKELSTYLFPRRGRFDDSEQIPNDGKKRNSAIISGEGSHSLNVLAAGLQSGLTSPARPWFKLTLEDPDLSKNRNARMWLDDTRDRILRVMAGSNFYTAVHGIYLELGVFGTGTMFIDKDRESVIRCRPFTMGEYYINHDQNQRVDTLCRIFKMQAINVVNMFGKENVSKTVWDKVFSPVSGTGTKASSIYDWIDIVHFAEPNKNREIGKTDNKNMKFQSVYYEKNRVAQDEIGKLLSDSGYGVQPFMGVRWSTVANDIYGRSPGMDALGDVKMLQKMEDKYLAAINKVIDPPINVPQTMKSAKKSTVPGGLNYYDVSQGNQSMHATYQINFDFGAAQSKIEAVKAEIRRYMHSDLFQTLANLDRANITAFEISKRLEEKRLTVGPLIERFSPEFGEPAVIRIFEIMREGGLIDNPPPDLEGENIQIEIISVLAQAQKAAGTVPIEQVVSFAGNLAGVEPKILDVIDFDTIIRKYSDLLGNDTELLFPPEVVEAIRTARQAQQQAQQQGEAMLNAAKGAELLSKTDTGENNALSRIMGGDR